MKSDVSVKSDDECSPLKKKSTNVKDNVAPETALLITTTGKKDENDVTLASNSSSPAHSILSNSTPLRNDEFVIPSTTIGTPFRNMTPMHVPAMLSPLPMTPHRSRDSERSISEDQIHVPLMTSPLPTTPYR